MGTESKHARARIWLRAIVGIGVPALLCTIVCSGSDPVSMVFASGECTNAQPGASNYCSSSECGPCVEGEGDCDPGQCEDGLECVEEGSVDHCRAESCDAAPGAG